MTIARPTARWIEHGLAAAVIAGSIYALAHLWRLGYLPQPFFIDPNDTFMDWFNVANWAQRTGTYDVWRSIYPPLSFVFMKLFSWAPCQVGVEAADTRDCDMLSYATMAGFFILNIVLVAWSFWRIDRCTAVPRSLTVTAGFPMLFGLDRGNLVIPCFTAFVLAYGPLVRSARWRWVAAACAANFKPYLVGAIFPQLLRRRWLWFEGAALATVAVFILTWGLFGSGDPATIVDNMLYFTQALTAQAWQDTYSAASYGPLLSFLDSNYPLTGLVGSDRIELGAAIIVSAVRATQALLLGAAAIAWLKPRAVPMYRLTNLAVIFGTITFEAGAYSMVFLLFLLFMEPWRGASRITALVTGYAVCVPWDYRFANLNPDPRNSFLAGRPVFIDYGVTLQPFLRPALPLVIGIALALGTIAAVWRMHRAEDFAAPSPDRMLA